MHIAIIAVPKPAAAGFELATGPEGTDIRIRVDDEELLKSPEWKAGAPNPPLSPRKAIRLATELKEKLVSDTKVDKWRFVAAKLCHDSSVDRWYWEIDFEVRMRPGLPRGYPNPNKLTLVVLMDGTVVQPVPPEKSIRRNQGDK